MSGKFRKILTYTLLSCLALILSLIFLLYVYQDKIIQLTFDQLNKHLITKIEIDKDIDISLVRTFPQASVRVKKVKIYEPGSDKDMIANVQSMYLAMDLWDLIVHRKISINKVYLEEGALTIHFYKDGTNNFSIFKPEDNDSQEKSAEFKIELISLKDVLVNYTNDISMEEYSILAHQSLADLKYGNGIWDIGLNGNKRIHKIVVSGTEYLSSKSLTINARMEYDEGSQIFSIHKSEILLDKSQFYISGFVQSKESTLLNLDFVAEQGKINTLLSLLPGEWTKDLNKFQTEGEVYFKAKIHGQFTDKEMPLVEVDFGFDDAFLSHPDLKGKISNANLKGSFRNGKNRNASTSILKLQNIKGTYNQKSFKGNFQMSNFDDPLIEMDWNGSIGLDLIHALNPIPNVTSADGEMDLNVRFKGRTADFKTKKGAERIKTSGEITIKDITIQLEDYGYAFHHFNGNFLFTKNDLAINSLSGYAGKSHFALSGFFKNIIPRLVFNTEKLSVEATLTSDYINLEELLSFPASQQASKEPEKLTRFTLFENYDLKLDCKIKKLDFRRFSAIDLNSRLETKDPYVYVNSTSLKLAGGDITFSSGFKLNNPQRIEVSTDVSTRGILADSLFYIFNNFEQDFLVDKNLKGQINCEMDIFFTMDYLLNVDAQSVIANIHASVINGQLVSFEPMRKLSRFVEEKALENIVFSELKNEIHIKKGKIIIPEMSIYSNICTMTISGTHTFESDMDYRLSLPLKLLKKNKRDKDEAFGAIEDDGLGNGLLFLTIKGNTDDYNIGYDTKRAVKKMGADLKKEGQDLKDVLKGRKEEKTKYHGVNDDEYFDFD